MSNEPAETDRQVTARLFGPTPTDQADAQAMQASEPEPAAEADPLLGNHVPREGQTPIRRDPDRESRELVRELFN